MPNQALFTAFYVDDYGVRASLAEPFRSLRAPEVLSADLEEPGAASKPSARLSLAETIENASSDRWRAARLRIKPLGEGLKDIDLVPRLGLEPRTRGTEGAS